MPANNIKILDRETLQKFKQNYSLSYDAEDDCVIVETPASVRKTKHSARKTFTIYNTDLKRKVSITPDIIDIWLAIQRRYTIFDVINAYNKLRVMYQTPSVKAVCKVLSTESCEIKNK